MKRVVLLSLLTLTACSKKTDAPPQETATAAAPVEDSWPGKYEGDVMVRISPDHKVILITGKADGCTGDIGLGDGGVAASSNGDALEVDIPIQGKGECSVTLKRDGDTTLQVSETEDCGEFHGTTCPFNGTATRVK